MAEIKEYPTTYVLTVITGRMLADEGMSSLRDILGWMANRVVTNNMLIYVAELADPVLININSTLQLAVDEEDIYVNQSNWEEWLETWSKRYKSTMMVPKLSDEAINKINQRFPTHKHKIVH